MLVLIVAAVLSGVAAFVAIALLVRSAAQKAMLERSEAALRGLATAIELLRSRGGDLERDLRQDLAIARNEQANAAQTLRIEITDNVTRFTHILQEQFRAHTHAQGGEIKAFGERLQQLQNSLGAQAKLSADRLAELTRSSEQRLDAVRLTLEQRLDVLRNENAKKLDEMRATVDEKLQTTLEQRLGASFKQVSDRLEQVHRGLGEMQNLAIGVGDLKRVLQNVKTRGGWGEVQLGALLSEMLTPQQFDTNVAVRPGTTERVEYAIRLPGKADDAMPCWLPIDCKFPLEDWQRLQDALERADAPAADASRKAIASFLREQAKKIRDKYVEPPYTTDFAILFLPTEGLYAEMMAQPGFADAVQREYRVLVTGPMNLAAFINSLQLGFRTMAIERRTSEVWKVLGAVKTEFGKFGEILARTKDKLDQVGKTLDDAGRKSTTIARKLREVEALPQVEADRLLMGDTEPEVLEVEAATTPHLVR